MDKKQKITLMTEFRLADIKEAVRDSSDVISVEYVITIERVDLKPLCGYCAFSKELCFHILFAYEKLYCIFDSFCLLSTGCVQQRQKTETKKCSAIPMDTSLVVVDSTILLYSNLKTSDKKKSMLILEERPKYPGGIDEVVKYIQTHIQYPPTAVYKK